MSVKQTIVGLATYNSWRRGDETIEMPAPAEIGATIDHAVNLLRKYDEMERKLTAEREKVRVLRAALVSIDEEWAANHNSPFAAGNKMQARAEKALAATEEAK
jgi:hypothetical protein